MEIREKLLQHQSLQSPIRCLTINGQILRQPSDDDCWYLIVYRIKKDYNLFILNLDDSRVVEVWEYYCEDGIDPEVDSIFQEWVQLMLELNRLYLYPEYNCLCGRGVWGKEFLSFLQIDD